MAVRLRGIFVTAAMGAAPLLALLLLILAGAAAVGPALLAMALLLAAFLGLALFRARDLNRAVLGLRHAIDHPARGLPGLPAARSPDFAELADEAGRLLRAEARRAEAAEEGLRAEEAIVEGLPAPLIVLDVELRARRVNRVARQEFGDEMAAVLRHPALRSGIQHALADGTTQMVELQLPVPVPRDVQAIVTVLDSAPRGERIAILLVDRTRERAIERMRADFVANAGHELRTPLAGLIGFIETLRGPAADDPPAQRRFLGIMAEQAERMHRLIDDLLDLSRIELIEHQRPIGQVEIAEVAKQATTGLEPALLARKASLTVDFDSALPTVAGDADQLVQVLQNLLDNAMKHGGEGVAIQLTAQPARTDERWPAQPGLVLVVEDTGPGIGREHLPHLTERFYRVDAGRSRAVGGTGLGLAIVKHIVNRHRGQLRIESTVGSGTTVRIWLPAI